MNTSKLSAAVTALTFWFVVTNANAAPPFKKVSGGTLHVASGVFFPARVGSFRFDHSKIYGSGGRDAGAEYDVAPVIRGDVYVYPLGTYGKDFNAELRVQQNAISQLNKAVKLVSQARFELNQAGRSINGTRAQYELTRPLYQKREQRCGSQLYLFRDGPWLVQYRFSYPIEQSATATMQIADFLRRWQWHGQGNLVRLKPIIGDGSHS